MSLCQTGGHYTPRPKGSGSGRALLGRQIVDEINHGAVKG